MSQTCERCGSKEGGYTMTDYCAVCGKNLCKNCMAKGCCGNIPALSGEEKDFSND